MRKLVLMCGILASVVSVGMGAMSDEEWERACYNCFENKDKNACQALIDDGLPSVQQCNKDSCRFVGAVYSIVERSREAIPYLKKAIALRDIPVSYLLLGYAYEQNTDYYNAKKYYEIACNKGNGDLTHAEGCFNLGLMYYNGKVARQDYYKAAELYKKACDMKLGVACNNLGVLYLKGEGVRQNLSTANQYFGKACDLGEQGVCEAIERVAIEQAKTIVEHAKAYFGEDEFRKAMMEREIEQKRLELERQKLEQKLQKR